MKKLLAVLCVCALALMCALTLPTTAQATAEGDYTYELVNDKDVMITNYAGAGGNVTIPDTLDGYCVSIIGGGAFSGCASLTGVTIPVGVSEIAAGAFSDCDNLTEVTFKDRVITDGNGSSLGFDSLLAAANQKKLSVGQSAFADCDSLAVVNIAKRVAVIGEGAFSGCNSLDVVYYSGTQSQWKKISIGEDNDPLKMAEICCSDHTHKYEEVVTAPTCLKGGYTTYTCACRDSYVANETGKLGHRYENGSCLRCGDTPESVKITAQPADGYAPKGSKGKVTVQATGDGLTYTWYHKNAKASSFIVAATSGNTYATTMSSSTNGRYVYCVITDRYGNSVTTDTARVFMGSPIEIVAQPKDSYAPRGSKGKVTVEATGEGLTYTWYHKNAKASSFIVAATSGPTYATTMSSSTHGRYVYCVITDQNGNCVTTDTVQVFMGSLIEITVQPKDGYAPKGSKGKVTVQATGNDLTYTWYHKNAKASNFVVADTSGSTYATTMSSSTDGRYVYCVITDRDGNSVTTDTARVFMGYPVKLSAQPADGYAPKGGKGRVTVQATGEGLTYKWYHKNAKASSFVEAPTTGSTYATTMSSSTDGRYVYCVVTDKFGNSVTTETARLFMGTPLAITAQPKDGYAPKGSKGKVSVKATGEGLTYTWYHKNAKASTFIVADTTGSTYATTMSSSTDGRYVYCVVTDKFGNSVTSNTARLWIG